MKKTTPLVKRTYFFLTFLFISFLGVSQTLTSPQVPFVQRTSTATPSQTIYNVKGDFTLLGNTNLSLVNYATGTDNEGNIMKYVDIDNDPNTLNSSMATLELSNSGENSANQNCSTVLFAGLYWTGKSDDTNETFSISNITATHNFTIPHTNYVLTISLGGSSSNNYFPIYTFTGNGHSYAFSFTNAALSGNSTVTLTLDGVAQPAINVSYSSGTATFTTPYTSDVAFGTAFTINSLTRNTSKNYSLAQYQSTSYANVAYSPSKSYNKMEVSLKGPGASTYTSITTTSAIRFPGAANSGIFIGYQEITAYVKAHGAGAYTVADIALKEGTNSNPGLSGGWGMVVIYENPVMKSRAVTLFDGYAYVNGQLSGGGEYGNIPISGFTTVGAGQVNMKLGVMAAEGDVSLTGDYLAVQKLNNDTTTYNTTNYLTLTNPSNSATNNFFSSSIYPVPASGTSNPILQNNTGVDFSMFTIPNAGNSVIGNNQTATTFRFGSTSDVFTIFGFAMSVDAYIPEPKGIISVNSINNVTNPPILNALPGQSINYSLTITNEGTEATNNTIVTIPIPAAAIFQTGTIVYHTYHGYNPGTIPTYNSVTNGITWNLGTLPITAGHPEYIYADISFTLDVTTDCGILLNAGCSPEISLETGTITGTGAISGSPFTKYFFQGYDTSSCHLPITGSVKVAINTSSCLASMAGPDQIASCGGESVTLAATEATGSWTIISGPLGGGEIFSNSTSPTSGFYSPNYGAYTLRWTTTCGATDDVIITFVPCDKINFDGIDDNINFKNEFNLNSGAFSIEAWVKSNAYNSNVQTILSKRFNTSSNDGYDLRLVNNYISFNWNNGNAITSPYQIDTDRWYHIAVTFSGLNYNLYIDGVLVAGPVSGSSPTNNSVNCIVGAMDQNNVTPFNYFNGWMDELRIWKVALTIDQIHQMMNQEIYNDGNGNVKGAIVPKNISALAWSNLAGYYQMNETTDINNGYLLDISPSIINGKLKNIYTQQPDTAPIPYYSGADGNWETDETWANYPVWDVPNSIGIDDSTKIDWNIVETSNDVTSNRNKTVLGLVIESNTLSASNDSKIQVSSYLKLDGKIDLKGMSQLIQTTDSDLDVTSAGSMERDQQGQTNIYNYNYWSSPVSPINTIANNTNYTVAGIMKDGSTSTPQDINWIGGYDGSPTIPISLASYWLYTFDNYINEYANWNQILETTPIRVGQGYTLKGSGAEGATQNYTFVGKPNSGTITSNSVSVDQLLLTGNPYPSALDATAFINDNSNSIDGTLYFWEHYATNDTHILRDYQGGYAERNLTGGVPPTSSGVDYISGLGSPTMGVPNQFIPVGQGFFVNGSETGGTITFNNAQRSFHKENETNVSNVMYKIASNTKIKTNVNDNDPIVANNNTLKRIRLGYNSNNLYHRQVLLGFMNEKATSRIDYGYDGYNMDDFPNDMYLLNGDDQLVIEGEGYFDTNTSYPIGVKADVEGKVTFMIDAVENFDPEQPIFIYDNQTDTYHNIRTQSFDVTIPVGENTSRFALRFTDKTLSVKDNVASDNTINISHIQNGNILVINNRITDVTVQKVNLYDILGQSIASWNTEKFEQQNIQIPIKTVSPGVYIAKVKTTNGDLSKKILIQ